MSDGAQGDAHTDDTKLHGKPDKTLRFSLCSDNLEGISEGWSAVASHVTHNMMQPETGKILGVKKTSLFDFWRSKCDWLWLTLLPECVLKYVFPL